MFFLIEFPWIEAVMLSEESKFPIWHPNFPGFSCGVSEELRDVGLQCNCGLTDVEELVDQHACGNIYNANSPSSNGGARY